MGACQRLAVHGRLVVRALLLLAVLLPSVSVGGMVPVTSAVSPGVNGRIAFVEFGTGAQSDQGTLVIVDENGQNRQTPVTMRDMFGPVWSPEGTKIAFSASTGSGSDIKNIFMLDVITGQVSQLTNETTPNRYSADPTWSPDGQRIAFVSNRDGVGPFPRPDLYVMPAISNSVATRLTFIGSSSNPRSVWTPDWSPDSPAGQRIVFATDEGTVSSSPTAAGIYSIDPSVPNSAVPLTSTTTYSRVEGPSTISGVHHDTSPKWSPDGQHIIFVGDKDRQSTTHGTFGGLYRMNRDGSGLTALSQGQPNFRHAAYSPDGMSIVAAVSFGFGSYAVVRAPIITPTAFTTLSSRPGQHQLAPSWQSVVSIDDLVDRCPDGQSTTDTDQDGLWDCWEVAPAGIRNRHGNVVFDLTSDNLRPEIGRKDLYLEIDWTLDQDPGDDVPRLVREALKKRGVDLHYERSEQVGTIGNALSADGLLGDAEGRLDPLEVRRATLGTLAERHSDPVRVRAKSMIFRHALFAQRFRSSNNRLDDTLGYGHSVTSVDGEGSALFVLAGRHNSPANKRSEVLAKTLMHELGHTLGLGHGGAWRNPRMVAADGRAFPSGSPGHPQIEPGAQADRVCKPNYLSIMNYLYMTAETQFGGGLSFSISGTNDLDESSYVESDGVGTSDTTRMVLFGPRAWTSGQTVGIANWLTEHLLGGSTRWVFLPDAFGEPDASGWGWATYSGVNVPIDWNRNGDIDPGRVTQRRNLTAIGAEKDGAPPGCQDTKDDELLISQNDYEHMVFRLAQREALLTTVSAQAAVGARASSSISAQGSDLQVLSKEITWDQAVALSPDSDADGQVDLVDPTPVRISDLSVEMTSTPSSVMIGQPVTFVITVRNNGPDPSRLEGIQFRGAGFEWGDTDWPGIRKALDPALTNVAFIDTIDLQPGGTVRVTVLNYAAEVGIKTKTATIQSINAFDPNPGNNAKSVAVDVRPGNLGVSVSRQPGTPPSEPTLNASLTVRAGCTSITRIQFGEVGKRWDNARVTVTSPANAPSNQIGPFPYTPPPNTVVVHLAIQRIVPTGSATVTPIDVDDGCGRWRTLVGGGPNAFK